MIAGLYLFFIEKTEKKVKNKILVSILRWLIIIAMPFFLATGVVRGLLAWDYPAFEYDRIPPDPYGFTPEERLELAQSTLDYLQRPEPSAETIYLLEELELPRTGGQPLYQPGELSHMVDVKDVADTFLRVFWILAAIVIVGLGLLLSQPETRKAGINAVFHGGVLTVSIVLVIGILLVAAWSFLFNQFHEIFFASGTWTFSYTDSLIRLFPEQFWLDFGTLWAGLVFVGGLLSAGVGYGLKRRSS